jgi:hypothetical protein
VSSLTWEEKLQACQVLGNVSLRMRAPGDWYVDHNVEIRNGPILEGGCVTGATTPQEAAEKHWAWLTDLLNGQYVVVNAYRDNRFAARWNGFMWAPVSEDKP